jgi:hypothetical protein
MTSVHPHPALNRDREEVRIPAPFGQELLDYLSRRGLRGSLKADRFGDVITLDGEPDMGRVAMVLTDWEKRTAQPVAAKSSQF